MAGVVAGAVLYGDMTVVISDEMLKNYLSGRIHGGFFGNAAASFIAALIWCIVPFISGLCAVGQPVGVLVPAFKGIGIGMTFSALLDTYGANGIPAFAAFILPSAFIGTFVCCYQCQLSLSCSNNILATLRGRRETAPHYYKIYIERFAVCCIGCFLLGIADAGISFCSDRYSLYEPLEIFTSLVYNVISKNCLWHERRITLWKNGSITGNLRTSYPRYTGGSRSIVR